MKLDIHSLKKEFTRLTGKEQILFTKRGNTAIERACLKAKELGKTTALIPDQGGWMTYEKYAKKAGLEVVRFSTNHGKYASSDIPFQTHSVLLCNSMPGYAFIIDMASIAKACAENECLLINDVTATIGTEQAKYGDIILGSFGKWKPLPLQEGGFLASNNGFDGEDYELDLVKLQELLSSLEQRRTHIISLAEQFKQLLPHGSVLNTSDKALNVIAKFDNGAEKEKLINLARTEGIEYTECPREIRVLSDAISFEIKRKFG